jgi:hypothetical protein
MGTVIHFPASGDRLSPNCYVRCMDQPSVGHRVGVGYFDSDGFYVSGYRDGGRRGLASSRKF